MSSIPNPPTLAGFITFGRNIMGIPVSAMPDDSTGWDVAYNLSIDMVPLELNAIGDLYTVCVYNFAGSVLLQWQPDLPGQTFFALARETFGINSFVAGVISGAADQSTSESIMVSKALEDLTIGDLQRIKDPYGRQALALMQNLGSLWGLT